MKHKIISTQKAEILVIELPEGATNVMVWSRNEDKTIHDIRYQINHTVKKHLERINIAPGDWQPLTFDEPTAQKLFRFEHHSCSPHKCWEDPTHPKVFPPFDTALESLKSLIDVNVNRENIYDTGGMKYSVIWQQAEESTFHNPHYFFKLK